jgi:serine/threonine-protein kinase
VEHVAGTVADGGDYSVSDGGMLAYVDGNGLAGGGVTVLNWADRKGALEPVSNPQEWGTGRLSPDMSHVANGIRDGAGEDVWTYDLLRRTPTRLTFDGKSSFPIWSPDGRWITFVDASPAKSGLYRVPADASGKPELLVATDSGAVPNSWAPDGKTLVFSQNGDDKKRHLFSVTVPGGKAARLHDSDAAEFNGEVSPDGHWLAYESTESGNDEIYVQPFPGSGAKTRISTENGSVPRWAHSGKELFFWSGVVDRQLFGVEVQPGPVFTAGVPHFLFKAATGTTWDVAADGKRFLVETTAVTTSNRRLMAVVNWFDELSRRVPVH